MQSKHFLTIYNLLHFNTQILMNVRRRKLANATNATAKTHGGATSAHVAAACCIWGTKIPASVSSTPRIVFYYLSVRVFLISFVYHFFCRYECLRGEVWLGRCLACFDRIGFGRWLWLSRVQTEAEGKFFDLSIRFPQIPASWLRTM